MKGMTMMKSLSRFSALALAILLLPSPASAQTTIVIQTWAGAFIDALNDVKPDIEKATGTKIEFVTQASSVAGLQRLQEQAANTQGDLWMTGGPTAAVALA